MTLGHGAVVSDSTKQKRNARSSTESEMIAVDDPYIKAIVDQEIHPRTRSQG